MKVEDGPYPRHQRYWAKLYFLGIYLGEGIYFPPEVDQEWRQSVMPAWVRPFLSLRVDISRPYPSDPPVWGTDERLC